MTIILVVAGILVVVGSLIWAIVSYYTEKREAPQPVVCSCNGSGTKKKKVKGHYKLVKCNDCGGSGYSSIGNSSAIPVGTTNMVSPQSGGGGLGFWDYMLLGQIFGSGSSRASESHESHSNTATDTPDTQHEHSHESYHDYATVSDNTSYDSDSSDSGSYDSDSSDSGSFDSGSSDSGSFDSGGGSFD